jgi:hypothetical protein
MPTFAEWPPSQRNGRICIDAEKILRQLEATLTQQGGLTMSLSKSTVLVIGFATIGIVSGAVTLAIAQAPSQDVISKLENNQGIFVDKASFDVVKGASAKSDPLATLTKMGAREVSAGAIIFRSGDKLYIVDGTPPADLPPQAMKDFQSNWNIGYMKSFQDNWNVGYMK